MASRFVQLLVRRRARIRFGVGTFALATALAGCGDAPRSAAPNVLVVVVDTLRADRLGSYGNPDGLTPFLDELAGRGIVFANAFSASSWTIPAVASLFTSRYPSQHRVVAFDSVLAGAEVTWPERLSDLGYRSLGVTSNFRLKPRFGYGQGFDRWEVLGGAGQQGAIGERKPRAEQVGAVALDFLDAQRDRPPAPTLLYLHFMEPHPPFVPPEPFRSRFGDGTAAQQRAANEKLVDPRDPFGGTLDDRDIELLLSLYDGEVAALDASLRALFEQLDARGFLDHAIVVIASDHGEEFREHRLQGHGFSLYGAGVRIPLIFLLPDDAEARVVPELVSLVDVAPTLIELLGLPPEPHFEGRSLVGLLKGQPEVGWPKELLAELVDDKPLSFRLHTEMWIREPYKLLVNREGGSELFDLARDPDEAHPIQQGLTAEHDEMREALRTRILDLATRANPGAAVAPLDDETRDALQALGYAPE